MHPVRVATLVALAVAATVSAAAADTSSVAPSTTLPDSVLSYYPATALAAGTDGEATLLCGRTEHGALIDCQPGEEQPTGQGFAAAALALAAKSADGCGRPLPVTARFVQPIRFTFRASPGAIAPDPRRPGWIFALPSWRLLPGADEWHRFYPERAAHDRVEGQAVVQCVAAADGRMTGCEVSAESQHGYDFGKAALGLSALFAVDPKTCHGDVAGTTGIILIRFQLPE
jgi:TonB family protein